MKRGIILDNKGEITPFLRNVLIVASLFIAVFIVLLVVYNVVSRDTEIKKAEEAVDLDIMKNSVKIDNDILKLSVSGKLEDLKLKKVKFIINDGTNEENISLDASDFETQKSFEINLKKLGIDYTKKITISIKPIIKKLTGEKELKVTDKISLSPTGETKQEEIPVEKEEEISTTITSCDKCGGLLGKGCDKLLCHSISEGCYYKGGFKRECASCFEMSCGQYKTQTDCSTNRCKLGSCIWENKECIQNPECGNGLVNASANEECDDGNVVNTDICTNYCKNAVCGDGYLRTGTEQCDKGGANGVVCTPAYGGGTCTYCSSECTSVVLTGGTCGDSICTEGSETPANCPADCVGCGDGTCGGGETFATCPGDCKKVNGETCSSGTECTSRNCVDNTCCSTGSCPTCQSCGISGSEGTCANVADGTDSDDDCSACAVCNGAGSCRNLAQNVRDIDNLYSCGDSGYGWCDGSGGCQLFYWDYLPSLTTVSTTAECTTEDYGIRYCNFDSYYGSGWDTQPANAPNRWKTKGEIKCALWGGIFNPIGTTIYGHRCMKGTPPG